MPTAVRSPASEDTRAQGDWESGKQLTHPHDSDQESQGPISGRLSYLPSAHREQTAMSPLASNPGFYYTSGFCHFGQAASPFCASVSPLPILSFFED